MPATARAQTAMARQPTVALARLGFREIAWIVIPLIFFAVRGAFSFQSDGDAAGGFSPGTVAVRDPGLLGTVILPAAAYGCALLLIRSRAREVFALAREFKLLTILALAAIVSFAWSQDPAHSLLMGTCYLIDTLFAFYLVARFEPDELMRLLERLLLLLCVISVVMVFAFPQYGRSQLDARNPDAWAGIFSSRSAACRAYEYLLAASLVLWRKHRTAQRAITMLLALLMMANGHVVTTMLMLALFAAYLGVRHLSHRLTKRTSFALLLFVVAATAAASASIYCFSSVVLGALGRDPTLTGRTEIWAVLLESVRKRPLLGYGFCAFWQGLNGESGAVIHRFHWTFGYAHNGYLEICLQLGLAGLAIFLATLAKALRDAWVCTRMDPSGRYDWYVGIVLLMLIQNVDDCTVLWPRDLLSILYIVACCAVALGARSLTQNNSHLREPLCV